MNGNHLNVEERRFRTKCEQHLRERSSECKDENGKCATVGTVPFKRE